jgi:hypothetical protein
LRLWRLLSPREAPTIISASVLGPFPLTSPCSYLLFVIASSIVLHASDLDISDTALDISSSFQS